MNDPSLDPDPLVAVAESFLDRFRRGERPDPSEYAGRHPELADQIRDLFPALVDLERLGRQAAGPEPVGPSDRPERIGEYRILREIGRGGMGVVYEAVDENLLRRVALKVLPAHALLQPTQLARFDLEARAAARLHHANIVPVFGVGGHEGVRYYAMQYIPGRGLDAVLEELRRQKSAAPAAGSTLPPSLPPSAGEPTAWDIARSLASGSWSRRTTLAEGEPPSPIDASSPEEKGPEEPSGLSCRSGAGYYREVARIGVQVAEALAYAHGQGVVHRDIKPSNLLLDGRGNIWVADFGLAKLDDGSAGPTRTGDLVGTLRYMAPERFDGWSDPRSDVYALGATLYELLTLRPAFDASGAGALIERIRASEPSNPRAIDRQVPRDLETIVLRALAKEPANRYPNAEAMAEDLRRFAADRAILSRRSNAAERLFRWHRRNLLVAVLLWTLALVLVGGLAGMTWLYLEADRQRGLAEDSFQDAQTAVDKLLTQISENQLLKRPGLEPLRKELLDEALDYYKRFDARRGDDPEILPRLAWAYFRAAQVAQEVGDPNQALRLCEKSVEIRQELLAAHPDDAELRLDLAFGRHKLGDILGGLGRAADGLGHIERACALLEGLKESGLPPRGEDSLREALNCRGLLEAQLRRLPDAVISYQRSLAGYEAAVARQPADDHARRGLAGVLVNLGNALDQIGKRAEAEAAYRRAIGLYDPLVRDEPEGAKAREGLGSASINLGSVLSGPARAAEAERHFRRGVEMFEALSRDHPDVTGYRRLLARGDNNLAVLLRNTGRPEEALRTWERAARQIEAIRNPTPPDFLDLARVRSLASGVAPEGQPLRQSLADGAVDSFQRLARAGEINLLGLAKDPAFDPIRDRADFQALLQASSEPPPPIMGLAPTRP